jgi:hypothetical protein
MSFNVEQFSSAHRRKAAKTKPASLGGWLLSTATCSRNGTGGVRQSPEWPRLSTEGL